MVPTDDRGTEHAMGDLVTYALDGAIATITMDDGKVNVLSPAPSGTRPTRPQSGCPSRGRPWRCAGNG